VDSKACLQFIKNKVIKTVYKKIFPSWVEELKNQFSDCDTVLDLGCGPNSPIQHCNIFFSVGVELFEPYLQESKKKAVHNQYIKADVRKVEFKAKSFDAVIALDVLEHLTKDEGYELIEKMIKWAKKKIIILTPNEYLWQDGYDDNLLQKHKCGWNVEELKKLGFKVYGMFGWKKLKGYRASLKYKSNLLWRIISDLTQRITYYCPKFAFLLFAVKEVDCQKKSN